MPEWTEPVFYLNAAALFLLAVFLPKVLKLKDRNLIDGRWAFLWLVLFLGVLAHFLGDLMGLSEWADHLLIHATVLLALVMPVLRLWQQPVA